MEAKSKDYVSTFIAEEARPIGFICGYSPDYENPAYIIQAIFDLPTKPIEFVAALDVTEGAIAAVSAGAVGGDGIYGAGGVCSRRGGIEDECRRDGEEHRGTCTLYDPEQDKLGKTG